MVHKQPQNGVSKQFTAKNNSDWAIFGLGSQTHRLPRVRKWSFIWRREVNLKTNRFFAGHLLLILSGSLRIENDPQGPEFDELPSMRPAARPKQEL